MNKKRIEAYYFRTPAGGEPVREWLKSDVSSDDRQRIGSDVQYAEFSWPIGMPTCRAMKDGLFEIRTHLEQGRTARILFCIDSDGRMVLLHGFINKTQRTPEPDVELARRNQRAHEAELRRLK